MLQQGQKESASRRPGPLDAARMFDESFLDQNVRCKGAAADSHSSAGASAQITAQSWLAQCFRHIALDWAQSMQNEAENSVIEEDISNKPARMAALSYESVSASCQASCCHI